MTYKFPLMTLLLVLLCTAVVDASDYTIPDIRVNVQITEDGLVQIEEHLTYQFDGSFSWAEYELPKKGYSEIRNIRVSEEEDFYINENTEETGTFSVSENNQSLFIKWHYNATDTSRTFSVAYELAEALAVGAEWTEFFWNFLAEGRDKATDNLEIVVTLPENISPDSLHAWNRMAEEQFNIQTEPGRFIIVAENISRKQSAEFRLLFPSTQLDDQVTVTDPQLTLESVRSEEKAYQQELQEQAEKDAYYASITKSVTLGIIVISIGVFIVVYQKYGKRHSSATVSKTETIVIPDQTRPAVIGRLMANHQTTAQHLAATLFDLARRGWFTIKEEEKEKDGWFSSEKNEFKISANKPPDDTPVKYEQMLIEFVNKQIAAGKETFGELFKGSSSKVSKWYSSWKKEIKKVFDEQEWVDKQSYIGVIINVVIQIILLAAAVFMLVVGTTFAIAAVISASAMLIASFGIIRRTSKGEEIYQRWKAYREGLKNADKRTLRMEMTGRHFIYATALHLSEKQINNLIESSDEAAETMFPWIILMPGSSHTPASVAASVSTLAATGTTSFSSATGGTGATAGTAGGGASASAG